MAETKTKYKIIPFARWVEMYNPSKEEKEIYHKLVKEFKKIAKDKSEGKCIIEFKTITNNG